MTKPKGTAPRARKLAVTYRSTAELKPYSKNSRVHSKEQIEVLIEGIKRFGWTNPILVDSEGEVIAGHARLAAAKRMGLKEVPTIAIADLSEAERRAYVIADNQLVLRGAWDMGVLQTELQALKGFGFDLAFTGFQDLEIGSIMAWAEPNAGLTDPESTPDLPMNPISAPGDLWVLGKHRLLCGDSTKPEHVGRMLAGAKPHLMVTDPPYGVDYDPTWRNNVLRSDGSRVGARAVGLVSNDHQDDWSDAWKLFGGDVAYIWHGSLNTPVVATSLVSSGFELRSNIIWAKQQFAIGRGDYHWQHEPCWYAVRRGKRGHWSGDRKQTTIWNIDKQHRSETGHSTQKPIECMRRPMLNNSKKGDGIYDPFCGSGTTIIAAEMEARRCWALELEPAYIDVAVRRWQEFTGLKAVLDGTNQTFDQVEAERKSKPRAKKSKAKKPPAAARAPAVAATPQ